METNLDLKWIKSELDSADWQEVDEYSHAKFVYLGTVFGLTPSGKYYTPWANSNVKLCPECKGSGTTTSMLVRKVYYAVMDTRGKLFAPGSKAMIASHVLAKPFAPNVCPECEGMGSKEAYLDSLWYEQTENELESIGASLQSGEGDPCDLYATVYEDYE